MLGMYPAAMIPIVSAADARCESFLGELSRMISSNVISTDAVQAVSWCLSSSLFPHQSSPDVCQEQRNIPSSEAVAADVAMLHQS